MWLFLWVKYVVISELGEVECVFVYFRLMIVVY